MMNIKILIDYLNYLYIDDNKINKYIIKYLNLLYFNFKIYVLINKLYHNNYLKIESKIDKTASF